MERMCRQGTGLFPSPDEIQFSCSCPDWASMCKHVAAVLYGVGARLDQQPELLFKLHKVDEKELIAQVGPGAPAGRKDARRGEDPRQRRPLRDLWVGDGAKRGCRGPVAGSVGKAQARKKAGQQES